MAARCGRAGYGRSGDEIPFGVDLGIKAEPRSAPFGIQFRAEVVILAGFMIFELQDGRVGRPLNQRVNAVFLSVRYAAVMIRSVVIKLERFGSVHGRSVNFQNLIALFGTVNRLRGPRQFVVIVDVAAHKDGGNVAEKSGLGVAVIRVGSSNMAIC